MEKAPETMKNTDTADVELFLISGFLGSGKTTFLKKLLNEGAQIPTGVIVNEFGRESIDGRILRAEGIPLTELTNGSIFCACLKPNFVKALAVFLTKPIRRLFVEASGMADPSSMEKLLEELTPLLQRNYQTSRRYRYRGSVCMVDAGHFLGLSEYLNPVISQVRKSSVVLLNKIDTVTKEGASMVEARIREIHPGVPIFQTTYAKIPEEALAQCLQGEMLPPEDSENLPSNRPFGGSLYLPAFQTDMNVEGFLRAIAPKMIRMKGFFYKGSQLYHADCVGSDLRIAPTDLTVDELANEIILIGATSENLTDFLTDKMKEFFGEDLEQVIFLPN